MRQEASYPHGHTDGTVHIALVQPAVLGDPALLRAEGRSILGEKDSTESDYRLMQRIFRECRL